MQKIVLTLILFLAAAPLAFAVGEDGVTGLPIRTEDNLAQVQAALNTKDEPERGQWPLPKVPTIHVKTMGLHVFFDVNGTVSHIRLAAPFSGTVRGLHIGDDLAKMQNLLGDPLRPPYVTSTDHITYDYTLNTTTNLSISVNRGSDMIEVFDLYK